MHEHGCGNSRGEDDPSARGVHAAQSSSALKLISPALRLAGSPTVMFTSALDKRSVEQRKGTSQRCRSAKRSGLLPKESPACRLRRQRGASLADAPASEE